MALWNFLKNSVPSQLGAAGHMAQSVAQPFTNLFGNGGAEFWNGPQDPQAAHDMSNALMTMYGGSAMNPAEEGALNAGLKVYRGSPVHETWPPQTIPANEVWPESNPQRTFWASTSPKVAETYADRLGSYADPNIMPADADFKNPLVVDAKGNSWTNIPIDPSFAHLLPPHLSGNDAVTTDTLAMAARDKHDGLIVNNVLDHLGNDINKPWLWAPAPKPATTVAALQPGTVKSPLTGETLFSGSDKGPNPMVAAMMAESQPQNALTGIKAYHGSPYDFDRFDSSKIGTGEGAQAYGHGLYFAESPGVAQSYRDHLGPQGWDPSDLAPYLNGEVLKKPDEISAAVYLRNHGDYDKAIARARSDAKTIQGIYDEDIGKAWPWQRSAISSNNAHLISGRDSLNRAADTLESWKSSGATLEHKPAPTGKMYEVNINADPASFYDYDKGFSEQPSQVKSAIDSTLKGFAENGRPGKAFSPTDPEAAAALAKQGIPGIRYLDQGSRAAGEGSHNYVVFPGNEHLIEIVKKYGIAATAAMMGMKGNDLSQMMGLVGPQAGPQQAPQK